MSSSDRILRLHIQLNDWKPAIWRRVEVPATTSLKALHDLVQAVMPFENRHLFEFRVEGKRYAIPDPECDSPGDKTHSDPRHESHAELNEWSGGPFDPDDIRRDEIPKRVQKLARRRTLGKAGFAKSQNPIQ